MAVVPTGTIEDHHGMGISGDLAADLAEVMVHRDGIADRHDQRRRLALRQADRTKHIGRGEAEVLRCRRPAAVPAHVIAWRELRNRWFADSALEGTGFEPSV